jgi:hypothetical protein
MIFKRKRSLQKEKKKKEEAHKSQRKAEGVVHSVVEYLPSICKA